MLCLLERVLLLVLCVLSASRRHSSISAWQSSDEMKAIASTFHRASCLDSFGERCRSLSALSQLLFAVVPAHTTRARHFSSMDFQYSLSNAKTSEVANAWFRGFPELMRRSPRCNETQMLSDSDEQIDASLLPRNPESHTRERISDARSVAAWIDQQGGNTGGATIVAVPGSGLGVVAARPAERGSTLLTVPLSLGITTERALRSSIGSYLAEFDPWLGDYAFIALALIHERRLGTESELSSWVLSEYLLPSNGFSDLPLVWGEDGLTILESATSAGAAARFESIRLDYAWLEENVFSTNPMIFPPFVFSFDAYVAAVALSISRSLPVIVEGGTDVQLILLPMLDLINHNGKSPTVSLKMQAAQGGFMIRKETPACVSVVATCDVDADEALTFRYSDATPGQLFLDQGFLEEPTMPVASGTFALESEDPNLDEKTDILEGAGLGTEETWSFAENVEPDPDVMKFLRLKHLKGADTFLLEAVLRDDLWYKHLPFPVSLENERDALSELRRFSENGGQLGGSLQKDLMTLAEADKSSRKYKLAAIRYAERRVMDSLCGYVMRQLDERSLESLKYYQERRLESLGIQPIESEEDLERLKAGLGGAEF